MLRKYSIWGIVPTLTFKLLYCFFVMEHGRRRVLHFRVTQHPTAEWHLRRLAGDYIGYYHADRIHGGLGKDTPNRRPVEKKPSPEATVVSSPRVGGLHHRYSWQQAA